MTKKLFDKITMRMETEGFKIHGAICDLGNGTFQKNIGFSKKKAFSFTNVFDRKRKIYLFPDAPHMLKLMRNHLFDNGFLIPRSDGKKLIDGPLVELRKEDFEKLVENQADLKIAFKLTPYHLDVQGSERQRVRPAAQLFSHTTATAMMWGKSRSDEDYQETVSKAYAVQLVNDWFDVMNSRCLDFRNKLKVPLGRNIDEQMDVLNRMKDFLGKLQLIKKTNVHFIKGIIASINSTQALYEELVTNGPFDFLLTTRLNQDCLENLFSRIRALGGPKDHPGPVEVLKRIKTILISNQADIIVNKPAVEIEDGPDDETGMDHKRFGEVCQSDEKDDMDPLSFENVTKFISRKSMPKNPVGNQENENGQEENIEADLGISNDPGDIKNWERSFKKWDKSYQGLTYLAGRIARKFRDKYPDLGWKTSETSFYEDTGLYTWLYSVSKGGLTRPSDDFMNDVEKFEKLFNEFHGDDVDRKCRVLDRFTKVLVDEFGKKYDLKIYQFFTKARTYIRIKALILKIREEKKNKKSTRYYKKMGHVTQN